MNLSEQVAEAKKMHWGMYCGICDTCTKEALCSIACPDGGVDDGQIYGEKSVVRCKDCKHGQFEQWDNGECVDKTVYCDGYGIHKPDWFCADGERRGTDG